MDIRSRNMRPARSSGPPGLWWIVLLSWTASVGLPLLLGGCDQSGSAPEVSGDTHQGGTPSEQKQTKITISRETTRLTAPLDEQGYVDYVAAINQQMSKGVTPETNAVVPIVQAVGPGLIDERIRDDYFRRLGI